MRIRRWALGASLVALLFFPALLCGQSGGRDALSNFPADTQQIVYSNLAQLRALPNYPRIRGWIFTRQLRDFETFLRSAGTDPEKDVDEVTLGWRADVSSSSAFGLAEGRLQPDRIHDYFVQQKIPVQEYAGYELFAVGSGADRDELFFTFLDSSSAAFGRLADLKTMLDVRAGLRPPLNSVPEFADGESELEGTSLQWGIARGAAAINEAASLVTGGAKLPADPTAFLSLLQWVLYHFDWDGGFSTHLSLVCKDATSATNLAQVLTFLRAVKPSAAANQIAPVAGVADLLQRLDVQTTGSRVEVSGTVPLEIADQLFRAGGAMAMP